MITEDLTRVIDFLAAPSAESRRSAQYLPLSITEGPRGLSTW